MAFQWVIKSASFPCQSIFQINLKKIVGFEMEKFRADLQMLEKDTYHRQNEICSTEKYTFSTIY